MAAAGEKPVLVLGDLGWDITANGVPFPALEPLARGEDVDVRVDAAASVGGSAWYFADALRRVPDPPIPAQIVGCVGGDGLGAAIVATIADAGLATGGIATAPGASTGIVYVAYGDNGGRLMLPCVDRADRRLGVDMVRRALATPELAGGASMVWLSGYLLLGPRSRTEAICEACSWAAAHHTQIVLDLVPHSFAALVGPLDRVEDTIGAVAAVVSELTTAEELVGTGGGEVAERLERSARALAEGRRAAIVQHRIGRREYMQAVVVDGEDVMFWRYPLRPASRSGLGDRMAVEALQKIGFLRA
jgi:sugar/nucleoside kinase (ribokinase family)